MSSLVRRVAGFWDEVISLWEAGELPPDFWGGRAGSGKRIWLYRANNHRTFQEQFEIANFYRLGLDRNGAKPYAKSRPKRFRIIQQQWVRWGLACRDNNFKLPECTSTLVGWARELRSKRVVLPRQLSTKPRVTVSLQQLEDELAPESPACREAAHEGAQGAAGSGAGAAGAQQAASMPIIAGDGSTQRTAIEHA